MTPEEKRHARRAEHVYRIQKLIDAYRSQQASLVQECPGCPRRKKQPRPCRPGTSQARRWQRLARQYRAYRDWMATADYAIREGEEHAATYAVRQALLEIYRAAATLLALGVHIEAHFMLTPRYLPHLVRQVLLSRSIQVDD